MEIGEKIYFEFRFAEIRRMEDDKVKEVSYDGFFCAGFDLSNKCFSVTKDIADISYAFKLTYENIIESSRRLNLNIPDIHEHFVNLWKNECMSARDGWGYSFETLRDFELELLEAIRNAKAQMIDGVRLFKN